jgi:cytochrome c-type biogenesis protein CcmH/NrfG
MTAVRPTLRIPSSEEEVLAQLGLDDRATPEDVARRHDELVEFLASAPRSLWPWARAQAALADDAFAALSDPSALRRPEALSDLAPRAATQPGGPATPPVRQAIPLASDVASETEADEVEDEAPGAGEDETFEAMLAAVTPTTHRDSLPVRGSAAPKSAALSSKAAIPAARTPRAAAARPKARIAGAAGGGTNNGLLKLVMGGAMVVVLVAVGYVVWQMGNPAAGVTASPTPGTALATQPPLDQAKVAALMAKYQADPKDKETLLALGDAFFAAGEYSSAADWLEKLIALDPKNVQGLLALGAARFNDGDSDAAKVHWLAVLAIDAKNVEAHYDLGFLYFNSDPQDVEGVRSEWGEVVKLSPGTDVARVVQAHLDALASPGPSAATSGTPASAAPSGGASPTPAASAAPTSSVAP